MIPQMTNSHIPGMAVIISGKADKQMRTFLFELKEQGKTILLASHSKEDISVLCDTVSEMDNGRPETKTV